MIWEREYFLLHSVLNVFIATLVFIFSWDCFSAQWAFRARENYESVETSKSSQSFSGLSSSIQFGYEEPFKYFYGIGIQPGLGRFTESKGSPSFILGEEFRLYQIGSDIKYFPMEDVRLFLRNTVFYSLVKTKTSVDNVGGVGGSVGVGWEFWLYDLFSLAPEAGFKLTHLRTDETLSTFYISLGLHFYHFKINQPRHNQIDKVSSSK